jgi:hypothetical protein
MMTLAINLSRFRIWDIPAQMTIANSGARDFEAELASFRDLPHGNHTAPKSVNFEAKRANETLLAKVNYSPILFVYFRHTQFAVGIVQVMRHEISPVSCRKFACASSLRRG